VIAGKAVAFKEALQPEFKEYCSKVVLNARILGETLINLGYNLVSGGTDTHVILIDLSNKGISGKIAENKLEQAGITTNKNMVPYDQKSPMITSGIRIGTPAITTRGMKIEEIIKIAGFIDEVLSNIDNDSIIANVRKKVQNLCSSFKLYDSLN